MWIGRPDSVISKEKLCDADDSDVVIILNNNEARELRRMVFRDQSKDKTRTLEKSTLSDKIDLALEMMQIKPLTIKK